jgi:hypothetical protein
MNNLIAKYRRWAIEVPEHIGELIAIVLYLSFMASLAGAAFSLTAGAYIPAAACASALALVGSLVFLL